MKNITEGLLTFLFADSATLPMIEEPVPYDIPEQLSIDIGSGFYNTSPYQLLRAKPVHASFINIETEVSEAGQISLNAASSQTLMVSRNSRY